MNPATALLMAHEFWSPHGLPADPAKPAAQVDDYAIGQRESLQDAVEALIKILGMQPCEGTDAVPPNARSHTVLLSGIVVGDVQVGAGVADLVAPGLHV